MLDSLLEEKLRERDSKQLLRRLTTTKGLVDFTSNDYLGLASSPELFKMIDEQIEERAISNNGSGGSRLLSGNSALAEEVESKLAKIFRAETSLLFNSGYSANLAALSSIPLRNDTIISDELVHACIKDGARLSMGKRISFRHNDLNDLERKMKKATGNIFIAVESIYSMDGDVCPLADLVALSEKYGATVILDEAHSTGVIGEHGSGIAVSTGLYEKIGIRIHTFGKAMGVHGACIAGSKTLQQYLINFARPFIYTTAMSPHSLVSIACAFDFLSRNITLQQTLRKRIDEFLGYVNPITNRTSSTSAIQTLILGDNGNTRAAAATIQNKGFDVRPILSPTVPARSERLRICVHAFNTTEQVRKLASELLALSYQNIHS